MVLGRSPMPTVMPNPQHDAQDTDGDPSDEHAQADPVVMAGGDPAGAVGGRADREDEHGAGEEVPDRELAELHPERARHQRRREEHRQAPPLLVESFALGEGLLTPFQGGPGVLEDPSPQRSPIL